MKTIVSESNRVHKDFKTAFNRCLGHDVPFTLYTQDEKVVVELNPTNKMFYDFINQYIE